MKHIFSNSNESAVARNSYRCATVALPLRKVFFTLSLLLTISVGQMWAVTFTGGKIYFRNDVTNWSISNIQIFAHQSGYTWVSGSMSSVPNTKLYYINASCNWGGFVSYRICGNSSAWGSGSFTNQNGSTKYTGANNSYGLNSGSIYLITPANANNGCAISPAYYSSNDNFLKYTATAKVKTSTNGSSYTTVTSGTWPATVNIKGTYLSGDGATTRTDVATSSGASGTYDAVATGLITMTYSSLSSDYAFAGWGTGDTPSSTDASYEYNISAATTVYAFFKKKYTVTFDANGHGSAPSSQTVVAGGKASTPSEPSATGYTFGGWYKEAGCTNAWNFSSDVVTAATTLYAKWTANTATVNFDQQSGSGGSSSVTATYDAAMPSATMPTRDGYTFGGYFTSTGGGGTKYYNADGTSAKTSDLTSTTTLYAKWTQTITLDEQGATTSGTTSKSVTYNSNAGMSTMITAPSKTGYTYGGYYTDVAGGGYQIINNTTWQASVSGYTDASKKWIHSGATTIYAKWTQTVTLNANTSYHGSGSNKSATATWNGTALSGFTATSAETGYNLIGYYSAASSGTKVLNADGTYAASNVTNYITSGKWTKAGATTLYAHMQAKTYSVTLDKNGGDSGGSTTATYNSNTLTGFSAASRAGYSCDGYFTASDGGTKVINADGTLADGTVAGWLSSGYWVNDGADITLYAHWTVNATYYTLHYTYGTGLSSRFSSISAEQTIGGAAIADNESLVSGTGVTLTATPAAHYKFVGWYSNAGCTSLVSSDNPYSFSISGNTNLYAKAELMTTAITLNANGGAGGTTSVTATHGSRDLSSSITKPTRTGYTLQGWYTDPSAGTKVIMSTGYTASSASGYTDGSAYWTYTGSTLTLYAHWTADTYKVTFDKQSGAGGSDNVTATYNAAMPSATMPTRTGYDFNGYFGSTGGSGTKYYNADGSSAHVWDVASATTIYAYWTIKNYTITYSPSSAPTGCTYTTKPTNANYNTTVDMVITPSTGYTVSVSAVDASSNTVTVTPGASNHYTFTQPASTVTVTVTATERTVTLTPANHYDAGDPGYSAPTGGGTVGISTTRTIVAPAAGTGYTFGGWTLSSNLVVTSGNAASDRTITVRTNGDGEAVTATANYNEVLTSTYYVEGDASGPFTQGWNANASTMMMKRSGSASSSDVYWTVDVPAAKTSPGDSQWEFKIYNSAGANDNAKWLGWGTGGDFYWLTKANNSLTLSTSGSNNIRFKPFVEGTYTFHVNYSTPASPTLTVTWPVVNQLRISAASPTDATNTNNFDLSDQGSNNWSVTRTLNAKTTYTFKMVYDGEWYGKNSTALTRASNTASSLSNSGADMTIQTDAEGSYTFTFNSSTKNLTVTYPAAHTITFGAGNHNGSNSAITATASPSFSSGDYVLDATSVTFNKGTTKTGYTWNGWYSKSDGTGTKHSATDGSWTSSSRDANLSVYACYNLVTYTITYNLNGGSNPVSPAPATSYNIESAAITLPTPTKTGYTFNGWYTNEALTAGPVTTISTGSTGNKTYWAKWTPKQTTITLNNVDATTAGSTEVTATYDAAMPAITLPTKTGYTFGGYWGAPGGSGPQYYNADGSSTQNWDNENATYTLFAKWTPKSYTVTLDYDETNHGDITTTPPTSSVTATYGAEMPEIAILPKATEGYGFMGYYSAAGGSGTQYYDGTGASVTNWDVDDNVTLYAYYKKAEITVGLAAAVVAPWTEESPSTVTATPTLNPRPEGDTKICWFLLQNNNNPVEPQPSFTPGEGNSVSFPAPTVSGNYKVVATLRTGTSCDGGDLLDADTVVFTVAGEHTVTILYKCGDDVIKASTTSPGKPLEGTSITAPDIIGYSFHHWVLGDGISLASGTAGSAESAGTATISYTAIYDGHITAVYTKKNMIYFNNTLGWSDVYVYFYKDGNYWDDAKGTGTDPSYYSGSHNSAHKGHMQPIEEGSSIYYFDAEGASIPSGYTNVAFTEKQQDNCWYFYDNNKVVRRGDYNSTQLPMFVPLAGQTGVKKNSNQAVYYNEGYWMNYPENTGYWLLIYNQQTIAGATKLRTIPFEFTADYTMPMELNVELDAGKTYGFEIKRADDTYYKNNGKMTANTTNWAMETDQSSYCGLQTTAAGNYKFSLAYFAVSSSYRYRVGVTYPVAVNDYRIVYTDAAQWSTAATSHYHPSGIITKNGSATEVKKDTVSFFWAYGSTPAIKYQKCTATGEGSVTWNAGTNINVSSFSSVLTKSGVYNFIFEQPAGGASITLVKVEPYTGAYYIRTDCAGSTKWANYRAADHQMTYSEFSKRRSTNTFGDLYSHYFTKWCPRGTNIKFCVANDYSSCVSDTLIADYCFAGDVTCFPDNVDLSGTLLNHGEGDPSADPYSANIRFMYNDSTNRIKRAYVSSSTNTDKKFLVLKGDAKLKDKDGNAIAATTNLEANAVLFQDDQNWIYEAIVKAIPGARIKIYAKYLAGLSEEGIQYFCGEANFDDWSDNKTMELIGGSGSTPMLVRVIYDFKTNRLVCAWMPDGSEISGDNAINADIMVVREHQDAAQTITFANDESKLSSVKTVYGAMKFNRWILNNRQHPEDVNPEHCRADHLEEDLTNYHNVLTPGEQKSIYERSLYFISFPFRVKLSEVFGFGKYWDEWYIEYYDGLNRAKNGYWMDSPPNWKYVTPDMLNSFYLEPNVGYILGLDLDFMQAENTTFWANGISTVELYFPSQESIETIGRTAVTMPALGEAYQCTINRGTTEGDRRVKDSYWRCIGVPGYSSYNNTLTVDGSNEFSWQTNTAWREDFKDYPFLYEWNMTDNTLTAQSTNRYNFKAMHAYLVQNGNEIHWSAISATPVSPIVARERAASQTEYLWRLTMECDGEEEDQAFIRMTDEEDVTDGFDFGQDLVKEYNNARSDIYTYIGYERAAANSMPLHTDETTTIPVGVSIEKAGEYTFAMPDGTSGVGITLVDSETGARTNLSAGFTYTVNFEKGDYNNRLYLEISPVSQISTGVGAVSDQSSEIRKVVIDGLLYIVKDGQMYDATGKHCK